MIELPVVAPVTEKARKPDWLRVKLPVGKEYAQVRSLVDEHKLHTICESGNCPNMGECWGAGTATFMILGNICTRSCSFCAVATGRPLAVDTDEPNRVANSVKLMGVKHCVITSVDRDDLKDGGSIIWAETLQAIRRESPITTLETLIPDFKGQWDNLYRGLRTKTGIMLGLGETEEDVFEAMDDLVANGVHILTLGQYLQPTKAHHPVVDWIHPDQFAKYKEVGEAKGLKYVESGPLVRSSYHAEKHLFDIEGIV